MVLSLFLFALLRPMETLADAKLPCPEDGPVLPGPSNEAIKPVTQAALTKEMASFCQEQTFRGVGNLVLKLDPEQSDRLRQRTDPAKWPLHDPWDLSTFPSETAAGLAFEAGEREARAALALPAEASLQDFIAKTPAKRHSRNEQELYRKTIAEPNPSKTGTPKPFPEPDPLQRLGACAIMGLAQASRCAEAMSHILDLTRSPDQYRTLIPVLQELMTDPDAIEGARRAALTLREKATAPSMPSGTYFEDIASSYEQSGIPEKKANELAWNLVGVIASAGPNIYGRLEVIEAWSHQPVLAAAIPLIDARATSSGRLYSYPPAVSSVCNQGKPYHFWMAAFLARRAARETGQPESAAKAAFTAAKGYQLGARTGSRDPDRPFQVPSLDSFNNVIRMDLAYAAAGALFGSRSVTKADSAPLDVNGAVATLVVSAGTRPPEPGRKLGALPSIQDYQDWAEIFAPDEAYHFLSRSRAP